LSDRHEIAARLGRVCRAAGAVFVVVPALHLLTASYPPAPTALAWRLGVLTSLPDPLVSATVGSALLAAGANLLASKRLFVTASTCAWLLAGLCAAAGAFLLLDAVTLRAMPATLSARMMGGIGFAFATIALFGSAALVLGITLTRTGLRPQIGSTPREAVGDGFTQPSIVIQKKGSEGARPPARSSGFPWQFAAGGLGLLFLVHPAAKLVGAALPLEPGEPGWHFGLPGTLAESIHVVVAGLAMMALLVRKRLGQESERLFLLASGAAILISVMWLMGAAGVWISEIPLEGRWSFGREAAASTAALLVAAVATLSLRSPSAA